MLINSIFKTVATIVMVIPATQATWCNYFYDGGCTNDANGGTSFDCANPGSIGSGGGFVQCHTTPESQSDCIISRCADSSCENVLNNIRASPNNGYGPCYDMGGAGPWYRERFA